MSEEIKAVTDMDVNPRAKPKKVTERSETWMVLVASFGALATTMLGHNTTGMTVVSVVVMALSVGIFAFFKTDLPSKKPGLKTKAFWTGMATVVGSIALALSETDIPGIPAGVTKYCALFSTLLTAAGYTVIRYKAKTKA